MPKHPRKRQKTVVDDADKDDEERRLESLLFGTKYTPVKQTTVVAPSAEMQNLTDADLFFVDDGAADSPIDLSEPENLSDESADDQLEHRPLKSGKAPAWEDPSDPPMPSETTLSGRQYESRLRRQYERINPQPAWAKAAKARTQEKDASGIDDLLSSTAGILASPLHKSIVIPRRTFDLNVSETPNQASAASGTGEVPCLAFHPSPSVPVLSSVTFHPSGNSLLLTGQRPFYFVYDLQRGEMQHKAGRGLWGSYDHSTTLSTPRKRSRGQDTSSNGGSAEGMEITSFDSRGEILAVAGRGGNIHLVDWKSGAGQVIGDLKCGASVRSLWWGNEDGNLVALTNDSEVYVWDVGQRRCVRRWKDDGGFRGSVRTMAGTSKGWLGIGSNTGLVNVYGSDALAEASFAAQPKPVKTIGHLTTAISTLQLNHDAQIMAIASREKKDAMRLIHLPSLTAFSNWPTSSTPLGHSEYVAIGNSRGKVLLYHLIEYGAARVFCKYGAVFFGVRAK
ncbi:WD40-repeat-containing domain protein [Mycena amicta]|nr:WD40-repeat-containing domain protein [Mycena amicta]